MEAFLASVMALSTWMTLAQGAPAGDLITNLPGLLKQPSFNQYSGYLKGTGTHMLHYWYVQSQSQPKTDPLIVWISDGPGCSTLFSVLSGNGPFTVQENGIDLEYNANSWNKFASVLYIESPPGVGFSYSTDGQVEFDDDGVTQDHLAALQYFYQQFPEVAQLPLYLMGEGYAGVYVPLLALQVQNASLGKLKGIAVGNGMSNESLIANSFIYGAYYYGLLGFEQWNLLTASCCSGSKCNFYNSSVQACVDIVSKTVQMLDGLPINPYNILDDCVGEVPPAGGALRKDGYTYFGRKPADMFRDSSYIKRQEMLLRKKSSHKLKQGLICVNTSLVSSYLSDPYVREALHIDPSRPPWQVCNATVQSNYQILYHDMTSAYMQLQQTYLYHILVYNGDLSALYNSLGNEWFVDGLGLEEEVQWRTWLYNDGTLQVAGFVKEYDHVAFATIKGAGHMSAKDKPVATSQLIFNFVNDRPF